MSADSLTIGEHGLTAAEAAERVTHGAVNRVKDRTSQLVALIIRENVPTLLNEIIVAVSIAVPLFGDLRDGIFGGVMIINVVIGIIPELRAKQTLDSLAIVDAPQAIVLHDGTLSVVPTRSIMLDDVIGLTLDGQVSVDGAVPSSAGLGIDGSPLADGSRSVKKRQGDQLSASTSVVAGAGRMMAVAMDEHVYAQGLPEQARVFTRMVLETQTSIDRVLQVVSVMLLSIVVPTLHSQNRIADSHGGDWCEASTLSVASVIGMVPQGLVLLMSTSFTIGSTTLARRGVLVRKLLAAEAPVYVDCLCLDKTGILTTDGIRVRGVEAVSGDEVVALHVLASATSDRTNATAEAIWEHLGESGRLGASDRIEWFAPFSSARKWSTWGSRHESQILGAPELVIDEASAADVELLAKVRGIVQEGSRVMALAHADETVANDELPARRSVTALVVLEEDLRLDAAETLDYFYSQDACVRIISGNNSTTVGVLAAQVDLTAPDGTLARLMDACDLPEDLASEVFIDAIKNRDVLERATPK